MSVRALRQVVGLTPVVGCPSSVQDVPLALLIVKASTIDVVVAATRAPPPPLVVLVQEVAPVTTEVSVSADFGCSKRTVLYVKIYQDTG